MRLSIRSYLKEVLAGIVALDPGRLFEGVSLKSSNFYEDFPFKLKRILIRPEVCVRGYMRAHRNFLVKIYLKH
jgi:hypothetical protein